MKPLSNSMTGKKLVVFALVVLSLASAIGIAFVTLLPIEKVDILLPLLATIVIFLLFSIILKWRIGDNLVGELGFLYVVIVVAYTILPAITFLTFDLNLVSGWEKLGRLFPTSSKLGIHLWRHVLFTFGVAVGYLLVRGRTIPRMLVVENHEKRDRIAIAFVFGMIAFCILGITLLSSPVTNYYEHYTRFDHLSWFSLRFVYICLALKTGGYFILITFLFRNYDKYRFAIVILIPSICTYEIVYSFGSRIGALTILLGVVCLYHYMVKPITIKMGLISLLGIAALFSAVELFRASEFNLTVAQETVSREGAMPAFELGAVYFTGFHLYEERAQGLLPQREWPMLFNDFIPLIPFVDHTQWNPQYWYARNYFPDAVVPPETLGPIADSAIWGGEIDLLVRSLINGAFFAYLVRWFLRHKDRWWGVTVYVYCYAICILTLKYSILYHLTPLLKTLLPAILVVEVARRLIPSKRRSRLLNSA